jgi:hypothetical protein
MARRRSVAVTATVAVLLLSGGAAYALVHASTVSGHGTATTVASAPGLELGFAEFNLDPITNPSVIIPVVGNNNSNATLVLRDGTLPLPKVAVSPRAGSGLSCSKDSFVISGPLQYTGTPVQPGESEVVLRVPVSFVDLPTTPQNGCLGGRISLTW